MGTDAAFPAGFMDVIEMPKSNDRVRLSREEAQYKLCRVNKIYVGANKVPCAVTHDGRTIRYPDPDIKVNDVVKVDIATGKATDYFKFGLGSLVMITKGHNCGRIGQ